MIEGMSDVVLNTDCSLCKTNIGVQHRSVGPGWSARQILRPGLPAVCKASQQAVSCVLP